MNCRDIEPLIYLVREGELTEKEKTDGVRTPVRTAPAARN